MFWQFAVMIDAAKVVFLKVNLPSILLINLTYPETAIAKFSMKFMQTLDILLFKRSISNRQFWYFLKIFLYKLDT
ncbi:MAG: hypothetical protein AN485_11440 [Anabaena sp. MDT14b]|nr:MAG: hypothetical protein AN485_11440 [Anabaena sp. MDT14b]